MVNRTRSADELQDRYEDLEAELDRSIAQAAQFLSRPMPDSIVINLKGSDITVGAFDPVLNGCPELEVIVVVDSQVRVKLEMQELFPLSELYTLSFLDKVEILRHLQKSNQ